MLPNTGEVRGNHILGRRISELCRDEKYKIYVETGAKNGDGSTVCFLSQLLKRDDDSKLYSLETNKEFYKNAQRNLKDVPGHKLSLLWGSLVSYDELPDWETWGGKRKESYLYNVDLKDAPVVYDKIPDEVDILLLDSGGWSRQAEWDKMKDHIKVILLDDTHGSTRKIREEILESEDWVVEDYKHDRAGTLCAVRKTSM